MLIKLNLEGELLEKVLADAKRNCRTNPQQIIYYLKQIYEGNIVVLNGTQIGQNGTNEVLTSEKTDQVSTEIGQNGTNISLDSTEVVPSSIDEVPKEILELDNEIFDF